MSECGNRLREDSVAEDAQEEGAGVKVRWLQGRGELLAEDHGLVYLSTPSISVN